MTTANRATRRWQAHQLSTAGRAAPYYSPAMRVPFEPGDVVQTPYGKGVVREARNRGRVLVDVGGRALEILEGDVAPVTASRRRSRDGRQRGGHDAAPPSARPSRRIASEIDLHGLTVEEALARTEDALNDAILADMAQIRLVHGRSGGRIRAALHQKLREISTVRHFRLDPRNEGVTIVEL
jgi:DNA mismatch repair protein MutS2